jgi:hypothetical protein
MCHTLPFVLYSDIQNLLVSASAIRQCASPVKWRSKSLSPALSTGSPARCPPAMSKRVFVWREKRVRVEVHRFCAPVANDGRVLAYLLLFILYLLNLSLLETWCHSQHHSFFVCLQQLHQTNSNQLFRKTASMRWGGTNINSVGRWAPHPLPKVNRLSLTPFFFCFFPVFPEKKNSFSTRKCVQNLKKWNPKNVA